MWVWTFIKTSVHKRMGAPLPLRFFSKSCCFQAFLRGNPLFWANFGFSSPSGVKTLLGPPDQNPGSTLAFPTLRLRSLLLVRLHLWALLTHHPPFLILSRYRQRQEKNIRLRQRQKFDFNAEDFDLSLFASTRTHLYAWVNPVFCQEDQNQDLTPSLPPTWTYFGHFWLTNAQKRPRSKLSWCNQGLKLWICKKDCFICEKQGLLQSAISCKSFSFRQETFCDKGDSWQYRKIGNSKNGN